MLAAIGLLLFLIGACQIFFHLRWWNSHSTRHRLWIFIVVVLATFDGLLIVLQAGVLGIVELLVAEHFVNHVEASVIVFTLARNSLLTVRKGGAIRTVLWPLLIVALLFESLCFVVFLSLCLSGHINLSSCLEVNWLLYSSFGMLLGILSMAVAVFAYRLANKIRFSVLLRSQKRVQLFVLLFAFIVSFTASFAYDIILLAITRRPTVLFFEGLTLHQTGSRVCKVRSTELVRVPLTRD